MYFVKTPSFIKNLFPAYIWNIPTSEKVLYLSFDDGPHPEITPWVLDMLKSYNAHATFFCLGKNVERNPEVFKRIQSENHRIGNHGYLHLSGWKTNNIPYFHDVRKGAEISGSKLFRPPYGRLKPSQIKYLLKSNRIVMWDVMSGDFDKKLHPDKCLNNVIRFAESGSIVVFHDSKKAFRRLKYALPKVLDHFSNKGYIFKSIQGEDLMLLRNKRRSA